jgi:hypothetical protein
MWAPANDDLQFVIGQRAQLQLHVVHLHGGRLVWLATRAVYQSVCDATVIWVTTTGFLATALAATPIDALTENFR